MNKEFLQSILRHVATLVAGVLAHDLVTKAHFSDVDAKSAAAAFLTLATLAWSYWQKKDVSAPIKGAGIIAVSGLCLCLTGCVSRVGTNLSSFVKNLPPNTLTDATQTTQSPFYSHSESVSGMAKAATGEVVITNLKASLSIPLWGFSDTLSVSGLTIDPKNGPSVLSPVVPLIAK